MNEHTRRGAVRPGAPAPGYGAGPPTERRGSQATGRIITLLIGQGHGFIRLPNDRHVFFHRSDVRDGTIFNDFAVGHVVTFELVEDAVSGPRAVRVERQTRSR